VPVEKCARTYVRKRVQWSLGWTDVDVVNDIVVEILLILYNYGPRPGDKPFFAAVVVRTNTYLSSLHRARTAKKRAFDLVYCDPSDLPYLHANTHTDAWNNTLA
jgi:hypothetical protein